MKLKNKITQLMTLGIFLLLIFGLAVANILTKDRAFSESENRYLQRKPKFTVESLFDGSYTADMEKYKTDQFILRDEFIGVKTTAEFAIGKKDTNGVYFGEDNYLIEKQEVVDSALEQKNINVLSKFTNKTASLLGKTRVSVLIVPTTSSVLKDKLPSFATDYDQESLISKVKNAVGTVVFPWVHDTLTAHKDEYIYYRTDHHWTTLGAYYTYLDWCKAAEIAPTTDYTIEQVSDNFYGTVYTKARLATSIPDIINRYIPNFPTDYIVEYDLGEKTEYSLYADEFLSKRDQYSYFLRGNNPIVKISGQNKNGKRLALIKDSFAHSIAPFLANDFEEVHLIDLRYLNFSISKYMDENDITDVMFLYNAVNFAKDNHIVKLGV